LSSPISAFPFFTNAYFDMANQERAESACLKEDCSIRLDLQIDAVRRWCHRFGPETFWTEVNLKLAPKKETISTVRHILFWVPKRVLVKVETAFRGCRKRRSTGTELPLKIVTPLLSYMDGAPHPRQDRQETLLLEASLPKAWRMLKDMLQHPSRMSCATLVVASRTSTWQMSWPGTT